MFNVSEAIHLLGDATNAAQSSRALRLLARACIVEAEQIEAADCLHGMRMQTRLIEARRVVRSVTDEVAKEASDDLYNCLRNAEHCITKAIEHL